MAGMTTEQLQKWSDAAEVVASAEALRQARAAEAEAMATLDRLQRATGGRAAGNNDVFDALSAFEARAETPAVEAAQARTIAARLRAEERYVAVVEETRGHIAVERAEARRPLAARAWAALEAAAEVVRAVQDFDEESEHLSGRRGVGVFWPEFARSTPREPSKFEDRRERDAREESV